MSRVTVRPPALSFVAVAALWCSVALSAGAQDSPIDDLLRQAARLAAGTDAVRAEAMARDVLGVRPPVRPQQRVLAWQIIAAARFPEDRPRRDPDGARAAIREIIRLDLNATFPIGLRWPGLDALLDQEKRTTLGMAVRVPDGPVSYGGAAGDAVLRVTTSRPSTMVLSAQRIDGGTRVLLDSVRGTTEASLRIRALRGVQPVLASGTYHLTIRASDDAGTTIARTFAVDVVAPALRLVDVPAPLDPSLFVPGTAPPAGARWLVTTFAVGTVALAVDRATSSAPRVSPTTNRANIAAAVVALAATVAVWRHRGAPSARNRAENERRSAEARQAAATAVAENQRRTNAYRARMTFVAAISE